MTMKKTKAFFPKYYSAAKANIFAKFNDHTNMLRDIRPKMRNYLKNDVGLHRWTRSHYSKHRYDNIDH